MGGSVGWCLEAFSIQWQKRENPNSSRWLHNNSGVGMVVYGGEEGGGAMVE